MFKRDRMTVYLYMGNVYDMFWNTRIMQKYIKYLLNVNR